MRKFGWNRFPSSVFVLSAFSIFLFFSFYGITQLGLSTDECVFVNAAIKNGKPEYVYMQILNIPFMTFMYEGALKAWLWTPIFKIFGVSVYSVRIPAVMIATITLFVWFRSSGYIFYNKLYSLMFLFLIATDPAYIHHTNIEYNTVAIHGLLISLSFLFFLRFTSTHFLKDFALLLAIVLLGAYNRFNFIWIALGLGVAGVFFNSRDFNIAYRSQRKNFLVISSIFLMIVSLLTYCLLLPASHYPVGNHMSEMLTFARLSYISSIYWDTMAGNYPYFIIFNQTIPNIEFKNILELGITLLAMFAGVIAGLCRYQDTNFQKLRRFQLFFITIMIVTFSFIVITPPARTSYHLMTLWPLQHLVFLLSLSMLVCIFRVLIRNLIIIIFSAVVISLQLFANYGYARSLMDENMPVNSVWTPVIYDLQAYVEKHAHEYDEIVSLNFGFLFQLIALTPNDSTRVKLHEEVWSLLLRNQVWVDIRNMFTPKYNRSEEVNWEWLYQHYFKGKKVLMIRSPMMNPDTEARVFPEFADKYHLHIKDVGVIFDRHQYPVFFLYSAEG